MAKTKTRIGRVVRVKNTKTKVFTHENDSYLAVIVKADDGDETVLMFTDAEFTKAVSRAVKNEEDSIGRSFISKILD